MAGVLKKTTSQSRPQSAPTPAPTQQIKCSTDATNQEQQAKFNRKFALGLENPQQQQQRPSTSAEPTRASRVENVHQVFKNMSISERRKSVENIVVVDLLKNAKVKVKKSRNQRLAEKELNKVEKRRTHMKVE